MFPENTLKLPGQIETVTQALLDLPPTGAKPNGWKKPGYTKKLAATLIAEAERVDQSEGDAPQTRREACTAWAAGRDEALAYLAWTIPYGTAKVVPPLRVDLLPLQGVMHTVQHRPDLVEVAIVEAGRVPSLLVPGVSETAPLRLAAWLEARALATLRDITDRCCTKLRVARIDIGLTDSFDLGSRSDISAGRISYSWRLIMAPEFVADLVVAREVATVAFAKRDIDSEAFIRWLCPDFEKAEAWLGANCSKAFITNSDRAHNAAVLPAAGSMHA